MGAGARAEEGQGGHGQPVREAHVGVAQHQRELRFGRPVGRVVWSLLCVFLAMLMAMIAGISRVDMEGAFNRIVPESWNRCVLAPQGLSASSSALTDAYRCICTIQGVLPPHDGGRRCVRCESLGPCPCQSPNTEIGYVSALPDDMPAHVKSTLIGASVNVPITNGKFNLGTWQGEIQARRPAHRWRYCTRYSLCLALLSSPLFGRHLLVRAPQRRRVGLRSRAQDRHHHPRRHRISERSAITHHALPLAHSGRGNRRGRGRAGCCRLDPRASAAARGSGRCCSRAVER
jgi:hypothetical protein